MDWLGNNVKTFKVKGITIIANRNNGMVIIVVQLSRQKSKLFIMN